MNMYLQMLMLERNHKEGKKSCDSVPPNAVYLQHTIIATARQDERGALMPLGELSAGDGDSKHPSLGGFGIVPLEGNHWSEVRGMTHTPFL